VRSSGRGGALKWETDVDKQTEALTKMIEALGLEIAEIKKRGGSSTVELHGGESRGAAAGAFLYTFLLHEEARLREDSPVRVTVGTEEVKGMIVSLGEGTVVVGLGKDFGPRIPLARLVTDDSFLLEALRKRLIEVVGGRTSFNLAKAEEVISQRASSRKQDVFRKSGIEAALRGGVVPDGVVALNEQYRMSDPICAVVNDIFYSEYRNALVTRAKDSPGPVFPLGTKRLLYVDTGPLKPWASTRLGTYSRYNLLHAILARGLVAHLRREGYLPPPIEANKQLGVVTPYAAQTNLTKLLIDEVLDSAGSRYVSTVHRFQGNEKTTMLIDIPDSTGVQPSRFIRAAGVHEDGARLLNVALSRARERLILLADFEYLRRRVGGDSVIGRILKRFENDGEPLDVADVVKLGPDNWISAIRKVDPPQFELDPKATGVFTEATFFPAFQQDVLRAKSSVVIFSPFATERGAGRLADLLRAKLAEGLKVRLVTRPPDDQAAMSGTASAAIGALRTLGVAVDLRQSMHEKLASIDAEVAWVGSLNITSHRDTSEIMFRLANREVHDRLAQFVSIPRRSRDESADGDTYPLADQENPACTRCKNPTVWKNGRSGIYFECPECGNRQGKTGHGFGGRDGVREAGGVGRSGSGRRSSPIGTAGASVAPHCPVHHVAMVRRKGRYGEFYGCPRYPDCKETAPT